MAHLGCRRHCFPPEIIQHAIWLYLRFTLSYRESEELLAERGLEGGRAVRWCDRWLAAAWRHATSERLTRHIEQLELRLEELEAGEAEEIAKAAAEDQPFPIREADRPKRKPLPDHLPRHAIVHEPVHDGACTCPACGGDMARLGEDVTEVLDYIPGRFRVIRHVRPKYACRRCDAITQAPAPSMPTPRGRAAPGMLAHLLVSKYCDHLPLY